jgi:AcrR family transcriptional regulator
MSSRSVTAESAERGRGARERILAAAAELFYREGVRAVGVDRIAGEARVAKMSLYYHFGSKDELVAAWLERRDTEWMGWLEGAVESAGGGVLAVFDALREWFERPGFRGCAFLNTQAELGHTSERLAAVIAAHKRDQRGFLTDLAAAQGLPEPERLGRRLQLLVEGAIVTAAIEGDSRAAVEAREAAERLLASE